jgi:hypothetical protein
MNDMESRKFEDDLKNAFEGAEVPPSENVWTNVELELVREETGKMKRRILFYQLLAAASITFAAIVAGISYYSLNSDPSNKNSIALSTDSTNARGTDEVKSNNSEVATSPSSSASEITQERRAEQGHMKSQSKSDVNTSRNEKTPGSEGTFENQKGTTTSTTAPSLNDEKKLRDNSVSAGKVRQDLPIDNTSRSNQSVENQIALQSQEGQDSKAKDNSYSSKQNIQQRDPLNEKNTQPKTEANREDAITSNNIDNKTGVVNEIQSNSLNQNKENVADTKGTDRSIEKVDAIQITPDQPNLASDLHDDERIAFSATKLPPLVEEKRRVLTFPKAPESNADEVALMFARLNDLEKKMAGEDQKKKKGSSNEKIWTSLGFAAGAFNATSPSIANSGRGTFASTSSAKNQAKASGVAYSLGVSMGGKVSKRWTIQGGVNYLTQMSDFESTEALASSNFETFKASSLTEQYRMDADMGQQNLVPTAPYTVNNSVEFISVPMQAGYLIVNKKVGVQVNAGVSTDLFLQNTIDPEGTGLDKTTQGRGFDSPYRNLNFSGLLGTELSYLFSKRYRLILNPGVRYPFNSIYKEDTGINSSPLTFDIGLRFRYIFH